MGSRSPIYQRQWRGGLPGLFTIGTGLGGPEAFDPGLRSTAIHDVPAGNYILICLIPDTDGIPHVAKGMALPITATAGSGAATPPVADGKIDMQEFHFAGLVASVSAGQHVWAVTNTGQQLHEFLVCRNAPGVTFEDVETYF